MLLVSFRDINFGAETDQFGHGDRILHRRLHEKILDMHEDFVVLLEL